MNPSSSMQDKCNLNEQLCSAASTHDMPIDNEARTTAFARTRSNTRICAVWLCGVVLVLLMTSLYYVTIIKGRLGSSAYRTRLTYKNPFLAFHR
jgi:hypothetical protein